MNAPPPADEDVVVDLVVNKETVRVNLRALVRAALRVCPQVVRAALKTQAEEPRW